MNTPAGPGTFADLTWQPRWNKAKEDVMLSNRGGECMIVGFMGVLRCNLGDKESIETIVRKARALADTLERTAATYREWGHT